MTMTDLRFDLAARMRAILLASVMLLAALPASGAKRAAAPPPPPPKTTPEWLERIRQAEVRSSEQWSVRIEDLATDVTVFEHNPEQRLVPASNRKLATFAMAVEILGPDHQFLTQFGLDKAHPNTDAHYHGNLVLRSEGDPSIGNPTLGAAVDPAALFAEWARQLRTVEGIAYVHGDLVIDATAFGPDQNAFPETWDAHHAAYSYAPIPSALTINQNLLKVRVLAAKAGAPGRVELIPGLPGVRTINQTRTYTKSRPGVSAVFSDGALELTLRGGVRQRDKVEIANVPIPQPLNAAGELMRHALTTAGVRLTGQLRIETVTSPRTPKIVEVIGEHRSPALNQILVPMMQQSDNFLAEQIWRGAAAKMGGNGAIDRAREVEMDYYRRHKLSWIEPGWDGCGLSRLNRTSPAELIALLRLINGSAHRDLLLASMPAAGESGTLRRRDYGAEDGRVVAKTGTLAGASALSGFILDRQKEPRYVFSIIGNAPGDTNGRLSGRITELLKIVIKEMDAEARIAAKE